jgi:hypothetical protein
MLPPAQRLYNEAKSAEILQFCARFDKLMGEVTEAAAATVAAADVARAEAASVESQRQRAAAEAKAEQQAIAQAEEARRAEEAEREAAANAAAEERSRQAAAEAEAAAAAEAAVEAAATAAKAAAAVAAAAAEAEVAAAAVAAAVQATNDAAAASAVPEGYYVIIATIRQADDQGGEGASRLALALPNGDATTVAELKSLIADVVPSVGQSCVCVCGGRQLANPDWNLRRCRVKSGAVIHTGATS